ncbi:alpha/beta fold hydrolase [Roseomonas harenae]|uniref:alpha/beta fold hydrolase n=1 Tax=Muricoccus harenae TaxID=2692566 RepID=UPI001331B498|nr:alpha/beta fold hydrolase [Roseomonas harenae]
MIGRQVRTGNGGIYARADGAEREGAPWIVLGNSLAADLHMWDAQIPFLTRRYRVLRYDTRGHGKSAVATGETGFAELVQDAVAVMESFGIRACTFMGLSLGGMTALGLALTHPDRIERLVCCDARAEAPPPIRAFWDDRIATAAAGGMEAVTQSTLERWLSPSFRAAEPAVAERIATMIRSTPVPGYQAAAAAIKGLDYLPQLSRIACLTLFIVGEQDAAAPVAVMRDMAEKLPGARLAVVPGSGHLPNIDNPAGFEAAVAGFLGLD